MEMGKSVAWTLFLAVVAVAGGVNHHQQQPASPAAPAGAGVQMAAPMSSSRVALDTTRSMTIRTVAPVVK
jgi:hypothetical protein